MMEYSLKIDGNHIKGELKYGEIIVIKADSNLYKTELKTIDEFTLGNTKEYVGNIHGGEVGIILDGRGRPFNFNFDNKNRRGLIDNWRASMNEYPNTEI